MTEVSATEVRAQVLAHVSEGIEAKGLPPGEIPDDFDLLAEGVIDSFGLLELIGKLEERFGVALEFDEVDPDELTKLGPFCRHVAQASANGAVPAAQPAPQEDVAEQIGDRPTPPTPSAHRRGSVRPVGRATLAAHRQVVRARDKLFSLLASGGFHSFGSHSVIQLPVRLKNPSRIAIGSNVFVGAGAWIQALEAGDEPVIEIGDGASIAGHCVISAAASIRLGTHVSFARGVYVADHTHEYADISRPMLSQGITDIAPVEIGDGAWLGENAMVLPGVRIGRRAVVSANSVVTRDVPDYSVAAGAPARIVRRFGPGGATG